MSVRYGVERQRPTRTGVAASLTAAASLGAGAIHATVVPEHLEEMLLFGAFFIACAVFQVGWAAAVAASPSRAVYRAGIVANGVMVGIWAVSRTTGLPIGPDSWAPEAVGALDLIASGLEVFLIALAAWSVSTTNGRRTAG